MKKELKEPFIGPDGNT